MPKEHRITLMEIFEELQEPFLLYKDAGQHSYNMYTLTFRKICMYLAATMDASYQTYVAHFPLPKTSTKLVKHLQILKAMFAYCKLAWPEG